MNISYSQGVMMRRETAARYAELRNIGARANASEPAPILAYAIVFAMSVALMVCIVIGAHS